MGEAILYTVLAVFAVYGIYSAVREIVLLITGAFGNGESADKSDTCCICRGCRMKSDDGECMMAEEQNENEEGRDT